MHSDHFFSQLYGLVQFAVLILPTAPNQIKQQYKKKKLIQYISPKKILIETQ